MKARTGQGIAIAIAVLSTGGLAGCESIPSTSSLMQTGGGNRCVVEGNHWNFLNAAQAVMPGVKSQMDSAFEQLSPLSPICRASTHEQRLVLTTMMLDRAALSAARGVDSAQEALGIKRTLQQSIIYMERQLGGLGTGGSDLTQTVITEAAEGAKGIEEQLQSLVQSGALNDEALAKLNQARLELDNVTYFSGSAIAGAYLFTKYVKDANATPVQKASGLINAGLVQEDFVSDIAEAPSDIGSAFKSTLILASTLSEVTKEVETPEAGQTSAGAQAEADLERIEQELASFSLTQTRT